jgi:hypothetical protein
VLPGVFSERASYLGRLDLPCQLLDLPPLADRLTMRCILEPFDHRFEVREASLDQLDTLRYARFVSARLGSRTCRRPGPPPNGSLERRW